MVRVSSYRGFGDSTGVEVSERTLVEDAMAAYLYVRGTYPRHRVVVWGHSMGSGLAVAVALMAPAWSAGSTALVLEAPLYRMEDAIRFELRNLPQALVALTPLNNMVEKADIQFR